MTPRKLSHEGSKSRRTTYDSMQDSEGRRLVQVRALLTLEAEPNTDGQPSDCPILGFVPCLAGPQGILVD